MKPTIIAEANLNTRYTREEDNPCSVVKTAYMEDMSPALQILSSNGEPLMVATVWVEESPSEGCVWIKNWSENEGVLEALTEAGVIEPTGRVCPTGWTQAHEAKLLKGV